MSEAAAQALSAALGGVASTVLLFPLDTIKTRIQASKTTATYAETVKSIVANGGFKALFTGVAPGAFQSGLEKVRHDV
jgi:hypothetical protein